MIDDFGTVELDENFVVLEIPSDTIELKIVATIYTGNGKTENVQNTLTLNDIKHASKRYEEMQYYDPDVRYVLTEKGEKYLDEISKHYGC